MERLMIKWWSVQTLFSLFVMFDDNGSDRDPAVFGLLRAPMTPKTSVQKERGEGVWTNVDNGVGQGRI